MRTRPATADGRIYGSTGETVAPILGRVLEVAFQMEEGEPQLTALADVILWEPDRGVAGLLLRQRRAVGLGSRPRTFVGLTAKHGAAHLSRALDWEPYPEAAARYGVPAYDEALVHLPQHADEPAVGVEALELRPALPAVEALLDRQGPILH